MRIWVVKYGETVPLARKDGKGRLMRAGAVAKCLAAKGHDAIWWTGRFEHQTKQFLTDKGDEKIIDEDSGLQIRLIDSPGYASNVSLRRIWDHKIFLKNMRKAFEKEAKPDLIVVSFPIPEVAFFCVDYGKRNNVPIVIDVRDKWPDMIVQRIRDRIGFFPEWLVVGYAKRVGKAFQECEAIYSITQPFLEWAQVGGTRTSKQRENDRVFHLASPTQTSTKPRAEQLQQVWRDRGFEPENKIVFSWAGSLTPQRAVSNMLSAFEHLEPEYANKILLVVCGDGVLAERVKQLSVDNEHILYAGFIPNEEVRYLYHQSTMGLLCYDDDPSFSNSFPNKFGEYLGSGLPILTTLTGHIEETFGDHPFYHPTGGVEITDIANTIKNIVKHGVNAGATKNAIEVHQAYFDSAMVIPEYCKSLEKIVKQRHELL